MELNTDHSWLLRRALQSNGVFSTISGIAFVVCGVRVCWVGRVREEPPRVPAESIPSFGTNTYLH